jgi:hypothetical protein
MRLLLTLSVVSLFLSSCFREDDKIVLAPPGGAVVAGVALGSEYQNQVFYSLRNGTVLTNDMRAWDLAFESSADGYHVWVNGGKDGKAATFNSNNYEASTTVAGADWRWDESSWKSDSTAIGDWRQSVSRLPTPYNSVLRTDNDDVLSRRVYLIDRGAAYTDDARYRKIVFQRYDETSYTIRYGTLDNAFTDSLVLNKNTQEAYTYFTFDNGGESIAMEPGIGTWDFVFTRYRHIFYYPQQTIPYVLNGVLLNPNGIMAALDSITPYDQITLDFATQTPLSAQRNIIGFNWKYYDFTAQFYVVKPHFSYVVRDRQGYYWKLRFLDFYNDQGEKGYPKFEYQRL